MTTSCQLASWQLSVFHDDVIKWNHFPRYWPFVRGIHRSTVNSPHKGQWRGALTFSLICAWINGWSNNDDAGDWRRHREHYDVIVMHCWNAITHRPRWIPLCWLSSRYRRTNSTVAWLLPLHLSVDKGNWGDLIKSALDRTMAWCSQAMFPNIYAIWPNEATVNWQGYAACGDYQPFMFFSKENKYFMYILYNSFTPEWQRLIWKRRVC